MAELPLISVIIPVYNVAQYLDACMESVLAQTYRNLEIILVDDGAKDESGAMCDRWAARDARIRVIHQPNAGPSRARNAALEIMEGAYVTFVDSDDILSPQLCQVLYDTISDSDIAICDSTHIFPDRAEPFVITDRTDILTSADAIRQMWYQKGFMPSVWGKMYRSELFAHRRFPEGQLFEDIDILHELFYDAKVIRHNHSQVYGYFHRENSITTAKFSEKDLDILKVVSKILTFVQDKPALAPAAKAYAVAASLRIWLNAPRGEAYSEYLGQTQSLIDRFGRDVLRDPNIRKKNRYALRMYFLCKPLLRLAYRFVNRWS